MSVYAGLAEALAAREGDVWKVGFAELERAIGRPLPSSAYKYPAWWSNNPSNNAMTKVWLRAGWRTEQVDVPGRTVVFRRAAAAAGTAGGSGLADRPRAFEYAAARAPETKMATKEMMMQAAETRRGGRARGGSAGGPAAALLKEKGADAFVQMEEFMAALPDDHALADLFGFLEGAIKFAPGFEPCAPAMSPEEWKEAEAEMEAEWDELYGPDSGFAKSGPKGKEAL